MSPRYQDLSPERLAARLAADVIDLDGPHLERLAEWLGGQGWELRKRSGRRITPGGAA